MSKCRLWTVYIVWTCEQLPVWDENYCEKQSTHIHHPMSPHIQPCFWAAAAIKYLCNVSRDFLCNNQFKAWHSDTCLGHTGDTDPFLQTAGGSTKPRRVRTDQTLGTGPDKPPQISRCTVTLEMGEKHQHLLDWLRDFCRAAKENKYER